MILVETVVSLVLADTDIRVMHNVLELVLINVLVILDVMVVRLIVLLYVRYIVNMKLVVFMVGVVGLNTF